MAKWHRHCRLPDPPADDSTGDALQYPEKSVGAGLLLHCNGLIQAHIQHHNDIADDLPKGQGDNSQVVPLQAQHRHPYQHAPQGPKS